MVVATAIGMAKGACFLRRSALLTATGVFFPAHAVCAKATAPTSHNDNDNNNNNSNNKITRDSNSDNNNTNNNSNNNRQ